MEEIFRIWREWLGPLVFWALSVGAIVLFPIIGSVIVGIILVGLFNERVRLILAEVIGHVNEFFLGEPQEQSTERVGGLIPSIYHISGSVFACLRARFQQRDAVTTAFVSKPSAKAALMNHLASFLDGPEGRVGHRMASSLRERAQQAQTQYDQRLADRYRKAIENQAKPELAWTHALGAVILTALFAVLATADLLITVQTIAGISGTKLSGFLAEGPIAHSFDYLTGGCVVASGLTFGVFIAELLGFLSFVPLHTFGHGVQRALLFLSAFMFVLTIALSCGLAVYRADALSYPAVTENADGDATQPDDGLVLPGGQFVTPDVATSESPAQAPSESIGRMFGYLLAGIAGITLVATMYAFLGLKTLVVFLALAIVALFAAAVWCLGGVMRMVHRAITIVLVFLYSLFNFIRGFCQSLASTIVRIFRLKLTDVQDNATETAQSAEQTQATSSGNQQTLTAMSQHVPQEPIAPQPVEPYVATTVEWNPLQQEGETNV